MVAINLANQHGSEGALGRAYGEQAERYGASRRGLRLVQFDFHAQCGATRYDRLELLWADIGGDVGRHGFFLDPAPGAPGSASSPSTRPIR